MASFNSDKKLLYEILKDVHHGKIQLPDFQRGWIWDDKRIKGILASVAKSFPIGVIMLLATGNPDIKFKTKVVEGVKHTKEEKPDMLILDGQQRITSLYQSIFSNEIVSTQTDTGKKIQRWYYIDMKKALNSNCDLEEAILSINEKKQITSNIGRTIDLDLSEEKFEFENLMFPIWQLDECHDWGMKYQEYWKYDREKTIFFIEFQRKIVASFNNYALPIIVLNKENSKEAVCQVFEKVNTGGVSLTVFELLTATYASNDFVLTEDWKKIQQQFSENGTRVLGEIRNTDLIQTITLLATYYKRLEMSKQNLRSDELPAISCKRKEMLNLSLHDYKLHRDKAVQGYIKASKILQENHIYQSKDLPYDSQLIPMAAILAVLGDQSDNMGNKKKLMQWFWCGVFGELYGGGNETRFALDLLQVVDYIAHNGDLPITIYDANFSPSRLHTLRTRNSAAYKGIYALLLDEGTRDWLSATKIDNMT
jgi:hypothetical protein